MKKKRPYLGPQGYMAPKTGFTGSAYSVRSNLVGGRFTRTAPKTGKIHFFGLFGPSRPLPKPVNRELPEKLVNTTQRRQGKQVAQHKNGSQQLPPSQNLTDGVNRWGPEGSLLGDSKQDWVLGATGGGFGTLVGVCVCGRGGAGLF